MLNAKISGFGMYLPAKIYTNSDFEKMVDTSDEWIVSRTGIKKRHICGDDEYCSDMATSAAKDALLNAGISPESIDLIIVASVTGDSFTPSVSSIVQKNIGAVNAAAFDINAACSGFVYGLSVGNQFIKSGMYNNILVIGSDSLSKVTDYTDRNTCVLFGDGAGAVVLTKTEEDEGIISAVIGCDGTMGDKITIPNLKVTDEDKSCRKSDNMRTLWMDGTEVFKFAVKAMEKATKEAVLKAESTIDMVDAVIPHQANIRIVDSAVKKIGIDKNKVFTNIDECGNMSAASIPVALCSAYREGFIKKGNNIVLVGFGGGLTWASAYIKL